MREFDALALYPQPRLRVANRTIKNKIAACYREREFFDGARANGYGGLNDDGRWKPVAQFMATEYGLTPGAKVLQLNSEKGFLIGEFARMGCVAVGCESSQYAIDRSVAPVSITGFTWNDKYFSLVIALGLVYTLNLRDAIELLKEIQRLGERAFVTLGAYETQTDYKLLRRWSLLGCTILKRNEWLEVMRHAGYDGDYNFVTARSLRLV